MKPPEIEIYGKMLYCPMCGVKLFDQDRDTVIQVCSHLLYAYAYGEEECFLAVRTDYAKSLVSALKNSNMYELAIKEGADRLTNQMTDIFIRGSFSPFDEISIQMFHYFDELPHDAFPDLIPDNTIIFCYKLTYSGASFALAL